MIPFTTDNDVENAVTSLAIMLSLGQPRDYIAARMSSLSHVDTRLNVTEGVNNCMLIYDDYTCDMNSLVLALDFMNRRTTATRTSTVILSDPQHEKDLSRFIVSELCEDVEIERSIPYDWYWPRDDGSP